MSTGSNSLDGLTDINILPTRAESRNIPIAADRSQFPGLISRPGSGIPEDYNFANSITDADFAIAKVQDRLTDYISIQINNRKNDDGSPYVYRFLINPESLSINRTTVDGQTMTRAGWQFGVWGQDFIKISGKGSTAGQYFAMALSDQYAEYTLSYRNLLALKILFENNGYWFEGENSNDNGPLASSTQRRRIKKHSDVVFTADNFIWNGMFQSLVIVDSADTPFFNTFSFNFIAWKERYRSTSSWLNPTMSNTYRGHSADNTLASKTSVLGNNILDQTPSSLSSSDNQVQGLMAKADISQSGVLPGPSSLAAFTPPMVSAVKKLV
jgi:hypothetical protein